MIGASTTIHKHVYNRYAAQMKISLIGCDISGCVVRQLEDCHGYALTLRFELRVDRIGIIDTRDLRRCKAIITRASAIMCILIWLQLRGAFSRNIVESLYASHYALQTGWNLQVVGIRENGLTIG